MAQNREIGELGQLISVNTSSVSVGNTNIHTSGITVGNTSLHSNGITVDGQTINNTSYPGTANNTLYVGSVASNDVVSNTSLQANLTVIRSDIANGYSNSISYTDNAYSNAVLYAANVYSNAVSYVDVKIGTANAAIANAYSNAVLYTDNAYSNAISYINSSIGNANIAITANASAAYTNSVSYTDGKIATANAEIANALSIAINNSANAYSNAVSYTDSKIGTANTAIVANSSAAYSNATSYTDSKIATANSAITANAATAYSNATSYADSKIATANASMTANAATAYSNATSYASNASNISSGTVAEARLPYRMNQDVRNTDSVTFNGMTLTGNLVVSGNVNIIGANNLSLVDNMIYLNANSTVTNPDLGIAGNYNSGGYAHTGIFRDATDGIWKVYDNYLPEPDASPYIDTSNTTFHLANFQANNFFAGNTSTNWFVANTGGAYVTGTVNAASHTVGTSTIANSSGVYAAVINASSGIYGTLQTASQPNITANNANYLGGTAAASYALLASPTFSGTLSATNVTVSANLTVAAAGELILTSGAGIYANGGLGTAGQVLHSNGSSVYWAADDVNPGTVTSIVAGTGLSGGTITSSGTLSVNASYIATISANSASYGIVQDTRNSVTGPNLGGKQVRWDFVANGTDGLSDGGSYHGVMTFQQWTDASGGGTRQLGFTDNDNLWVRGSGSGVTSYNSWKLLLNSSNYNSYAPTLTGTGASGTWGISVTGSAVSSTTQAKSVANTTIATTQFAKTLFYSASTSGTLDWNDTTNLYPGVGGTLLMGTATNGPGQSIYYHPLNIAYANLDGSGNLTQLAISYSSPGNELYMRGKYNGSWTSWARFLNSSNYTSYAVSTTYNSSLNSDSRNSRGVTRLYRRDSDSDYSVQTYWTGSYWRLYGYNGDTSHADVQVGLSDNSSALNGVSPTEIPNGNNGWGVNWGGVTDLSTAHKTGWYSAYNPSNAPTTTYYTWMNVNGHTGGDMYGWQLAAPYWGDALYFRKKEAGVGTANWLNWRRILHEDVWINNKHFGSDGIIYSNSSMRAPIFYDSDNTGYYFGGSSGVLYSSQSYANDWFRPQGQTGLYSQSYGQHFYAQSNGLYWCGASTSTTGGMIFRVGHEGTVRGYVYHDGSENFGFLHKDGNWAVRTTPSVTEIYNVVYTGDTRATILYDRDNTGYYFGDGSGISSFNGTYVRNLYFHGVSGDSGASQGSYSIYQEPGAWTHPYPDLVIGYHTGIKIGGYYGYNGTRFYNNNPASGSLIASIGDGDNAMRSYDNIIAYASDKRLKENIVNIPNAIEKIMTLNGVTFDWKDMVRDLGFEPSTKHEAGVLAQEVEAVLPEAVEIAPFDYDWKQPGKSKSGEKYLTVKYEKIVPLLIEGMKDQQRKIDKLEKMLEEFLNGKI